MRLYDLVSGLFIANNLDSVETFTLARLSKQAAVTLGQPVDQPFLHGVSPAENSELYKAWFNLNTFSS